jgi:hypothetical protein
MPDPDVEPLTESWEWPRPGEMISLNNRLAWYQLQNHKHHWLNAGFYLGAQIRSDLRKKKVSTPLKKKCRIQFDVDVHDRRRRDGHNMAYCSKWFIDGLVLAKVFKDDDSDHVELGDWTFQVVPRKEVPMLRVTLS